MGHSAACVAMLTHHLASSNGGMPATAEPDLSLQQASSKRRCCTPYSPFSYGPCRLFCGLSICNCISRQPEVRTALTPFSALRTSEPGGDAIQLRGHAGSAAGGGGPAGLGARGCGGPGSTQLPLLPGHRPGYKTLSLPLADWSHVWGAAHVKWGDSGVADAEVRDLCAVVGS